MPTESDRLRAVVLAGGRGRRLDPLTTRIPKPLAPLGVQPILDVILRQLRRDGFRDVVVSAGYLGEMIESYLSQHTPVGVNAELVRETSPLGTAGALSLVDVRNSDLLVVNGDVLTDLRFGDVVATHRRTGAALTVAVKRRAMRSSFGVIEREGSRLVAFHEKPQSEVDCSIGVNVYGPAALSVARRNAPIDFPDVVHELLRTGHQVAVHDHTGFWRDIGTPEDYELAQVEFAELDFGLHENHRQGATDAVAE